MIREHKDYLIGFLVTALIGATVMSFGSETNNYPLVVNIVLMTIGAIIFSSLLGGLILGFSWIFTRNFTFIRFIRASVVVYIVWTLTVIISVIKNMN